jgi:SAM-dependent methyltransferase
MSGGFADHFSASAARYAAFRPRYPRELFDHLARLVPEHELAWDAGTGNGQAALALAEHFARVVATDASAEQIARAAPHPRVTYRVAREDESGLEARSVDLATVAQALHWFDVGCFRREVTRVLDPRGVIAAWCYGRTRLEAPFDAPFDRFYEQSVRRWWPQERSHVDTLYRELPFPFEELPAPTLTMSARMTLPELLGYVGTWSATARARKEAGLDLVEELRAALAPLWREQSERHEICWPMGIRIGRPRGSRARL